MELLSEGAQFKAFCKLILIDLSNALVLLANTS